MKVVLDTKQLETIQEMLNRHSVIVNVDKEIQLEMKRANDLKEKEIKDVDRERRK